MTEDQVAGDEASQTRPAAAATGSAALVDRDADVLAGLGQTLVAASPAEVSMALHVDAARVNAAGLCHGGYLFALADTACAYVLAEQGLRPATTDANISYLSGARLGDLVLARARPLKVGRRFAVAEVDLFRVTPDNTANPAADEQAVRIAVYRGTCAVLPTADPAPAR